jgi:hypothetical protein
MLLGWFVVVFIAWVYWILLRAPKLDEMSYDALYRQGRLKTGTLVLFHALDNINPVFIGSYWGHIGVVWVDPKDPRRTPWIFEAAPARNMPLEAHHNPHGIFLSRLEDRAKRYSGFIAIKELEGEVTAVNEAAFASFIQFAVRNFIYNYDYVTNALRRFMGQKINKCVNCGELAFLSAIRLGILPHSEYSVPRLHHLLHMAHLKDTQLGRYMDPVYMVHAPFE